MSRQSTMRALVEQYLRQQRSLGFQLRIEGQQLLRFAEYVDHSGHKGPLTVELAVRWAGLPTKSSRLYRARRLEVVRCFARYLASRDPRTEVPPMGLLGAAHRRNTPHIYAPEEISQLTRAAAQLSPAGGLRPRTYATLLGLLACTGMRISEVLRLQREEVDLRQGILRITCTKFRKSRLVPLHPSAVRAVSSYARIRDGFHPVVKAPHFFVGSTGGALAYSTVRTTFRKICRSLGWQGQPGSRAPRLHDLRHTFAVRRLLHWYEQGVDVNHAITALATYLGHRKVSDTYWYLTATPELMAVAGHRFERFARSDSEGGVHDSQ